MCAAETKTETTATRAPAIAGRAPVAFGEHGQLLYVPDHDVDAPVLSIVIPALNEELVVGTFMDWCREGLEKAGISGEVIIIDSSTDRTPEIVLEKGGRVLKTPKRGLGRAYIDAVPFIRGKYVLLGDADCTYDFRALKPFVDAFESGSEFVMGTRLKGYMEPGSNPWLHRYVGTPVTTWILNRIFGSKFSDIHCGMRGITLDALKRLNIQSQSWEYASEMVLKSVHMRLATTEVPVRFYKDQEGRVSHHVREGWFSPWHAAWINLRAMFVWGADFFCVMPGLILMLAGLLLVLPTALGPISLAGVTFSLNWMLLGLTLTLVGLQAWTTGMIARVLYDRVGDVRARTLALFPYDRTVLSAAALFFVGVALGLPLIGSYAAQGFTLADPSVTANHLAILGLTCAGAAFVLFVFTLLLHAVGLQLEERGRE
jgi:glycosyltransferase involved in cell wall biosynthesis